MIVISSQIDLTAAEQAGGVTNNNPRIGWHSVVSEGNLTASASDTQWRVENLLNQATHSFWQGTSLGTHRIIVQTAGDRVNYMGVAAHNLRGSTVTPQWSTNGSVWQDLDSPVVLPDNVPYMHEFPDVSVAYVALRIQPFYEVPALAVFNVGRILRMPRRLYVGHSVLTYNRDTEVSTGRSESGQFLGRVKRSQQLTSSLSFPNLTPEFFRDSVDPFIQDAETRAFFWAWRPGSYPLETALAWTRGDARVNNARVNGMVEVSLDIAGMGAMPTGGIDVS